MNKPIKNALISVFHKDNLAPIINQLHDLGVNMYSTGGTYKFIEDLGKPVHKVEDLTGYPSILDGRVKTLHPKVFGGILARQDDGNHQNQLSEYEIPAFDLVIVDLYPFEATVASTSDESKIIEKIDIGGISLIRAAAKNYRHTAVVSSMNQYDDLLQLLIDKKGTDLKDRKTFALKAFETSSHYDTMISKYFLENDEPNAFKSSVPNKMELRYGENPHQKASFYGNLDAFFEKLNGKAISYNNLVDIDAAVQLISDLPASSFAVIKHTNACGIATREKLLDAWNAALAGDNVSAFGGILVTNRTVDIATANEIHKLFFEVLIAPDYEEQTLEVLKQKKNRILLKQKTTNGLQLKQFKSLLNGVIVQDKDTQLDSRENLTIASKKQPSEVEIDDLLYASICAKHLKSNTIALVKNKQLIGMGTGQTSRVDALRQAILKAKQFGFDTNGAVMASDAFFPFADCVEIAHESGINAVIQPGGSIRDKDSVAFCDANNMVMVMTGHRHFKH